MKKAILASIGAFSISFGANAAIYTQTFTGTVTSGVDIANKFGGIDLTGQEFVSVYTFNSAGAYIYHSDTNLSLANNGNISPNTLTSISINGYTVNFVGNSYSDMAISNSEDISRAGAYSSSTTHSSLVNEVYDFSAQPYGSNPFSGSVADAQQNAGTYSDAAGDVLQLHNLTYSISSIGTDPINVSDVPEATTWAMMLGGFGLVGAAMRRRRTIVRFA